MAALNEGVVRFKSTSGFSETAERLDAVLAAKGLPVLASIDHARGAAEAGLSLRPMMLVIFGKATAGTPLMFAAPSTGLDLPLKVLIWEDAGGEIWVSYNSAEYLQQRHGFPEELTRNIAGIEAIAKATAGL